MRIVRVRFSLRRLMIMVTALGLNFGVVPWPACAVMGAAIIVPLFVYSGTLTEWIVIYSFAGLLAGLSMPAVSSHNGLCRKNGWNFGLEPREQNLSPSAAIRPRSPLTRTAAPKSVQTQGWAPLDLLARFPLQRTVQASGPKTATLRASVDETDAHHVGPAAVETRVAASDERGQGSQGRPVRRRALQFLRGSLAASGVCLQGQIEIAMPPRSVGEYQDGMRAAHLRGVRYALRAYPSRSFLYTISW
jgi:hypothetical protein